MAKQLAFIFIWIMSTQVVANDTFKNEVDLGLLMHKGNTDTENINGAYTNMLSHQQLENTIKASALFALGRTQGAIQKEKTAEKYQVQENSTWRFHQRYFAYFDSHVIRDHFSAYRYEITESIGLGLDIFNLPNLNWQIHAGPGGRHRKIRQTSNHTDELVGHAKTSLKYSFSPKAHFKQIISSDLHEKNTKTKSTSELKTQLFEPLALKVTFELEHDTKLPDNSKDIKKTNSTTSVAISYQF